MEAELRRFNLPNTVQGEDVRFAHDVDETTRSSNENVTTFLELSDLLTDWTTTICNAGTKHGAIAQTTSLIEDLCAKLTSGSDNEDQWLSTNTIVLLTLCNVGTRSSELLGLAHQLGENRDEESSSLAGT